MRAQPDDMDALTARRILLIISGGIAAYKSLDLIRLLTNAGAVVLPVMTPAARHFITPLAVSSLAGRPVREALFSPGEEAQFGHIALAREADLILTAPASASRIAAYAAGLAPDLAGAIMLARDCPAMLAPSMNQAMWKNPAMQRALALLREDGVHMIGPDEGDLACGETGPGRMAEPAAIARALADFFAAQPNGAGSAIQGAGTLKGLRALVTSGPTREAIDPVRYLSNRSSGAQGLAIAHALARAGAETILINGPSSINGSAVKEANIQSCEVESCRDMLAACKKALPADIAICAAAVGDWRIVRPHKEKWKKNGAAKAELALRPNPDILAFLARKSSQRPALVIGFAAETENLVANAKAKLRAKGCDWILANDVSPETGILGGEENEVHFLADDKVESWPRMSKTALAEKLVARIAQKLGRA